MNDASSKLIRYLLPLAGVLLASVVLQMASNQVNSTTVALLLLLIVLASATFFGRNPALLASFAAMLCFNYFFLHPVYAWTIAEPQNLTAWAAFTITALIAGELSEYARRRRTEAERLYEELQTAFKAKAEAEALQQSEKLKSALLDAVTHDLRTPLTSIKASVTTLLESEGGHRTIELDSVGRSEFLDIINEEADRLNKFIEGMVALARVEANSGNTSDVRSAVEESIAIALDRAEPQLREHHLQLDIERNLPLVEADSVAIAEVLYNLIENAAKYSARGTTISITAKMHGNKALISVNDEGRGIPPEMRERVFEKFTRLDNSRATGLGLGMAIARRIIETQNGTIEIREGDNGKGTRIVLALPIR
jgi:K+-sensing histidine kinase KdpD